MISGANVRHLSETQRHLTHHATIVAIQAASAGLKTCTNFMADFFNEVKMEDLEEQRLRVKLWFTVDETFLQTRYKCFREFIGKPVRTE